MEYLFLTTDGPDVRTELSVEPFNAVNEQNDYEVWACSLQRHMARSNSFPADTLGVEGPHC